MKKLITFALIITLASCHQKETMTFDEVAYMEEDFDAAPITQRSKTPQRHDITAQNKNTEVNKKKIIKDGRLGTEVSDINKSKHKIDSLIHVFKGYYANENLDNTDYKITYNLTIRVPSKDFENLISKLESGGGKILYKEIEARDVTDQFIDLETRLTNKKEYLERYRELLNKASTVKEILEIEEKIRGIEEEIESTEGRLKYLSDQVDFSTLSLQVIQKKDFEYEPIQRDKFSERFVESISNGWFAFIDFLLLLVKIWPFWILIPFVIYFVKKLRSNRRKKQ